MQLRNSLLTVVAALCFSMVTPSFLCAQNNLKSKATTTVSSFVPEHMGIGKIKVKTVKVNSKKKTVTVDFNDSFADLPLTKESVKTLASDLRKSFGGEYRNYKVILTVNGRSANGLVQDITKIKKTNANFVTPLAPYSRPELGLTGDIIAMWQSHGWYFEPKLNRWEWQRARIFQTVEDLYTQSYVLPFLVPMLENAGAYVMLPRERDTNDVEIIVDNDGHFAQNGYVEDNASKTWKEGEGEGFAYARKQYEVNQNPFREGTYRVVSATTDADKVSTASWFADFPEAGEFAVYVSYVTLKNSADDVVYTVNHMGGSTQFRVNQKMGGGTWIYLGTFPFAKNKAALPVVSVSNLSKRASSVVTADAVKIGGGMGNIARIVKDAPEDEDNPYNPNIDYKYQISKYPRFVEGARYWLQWAGIPDTVYSPSNNVDDYVDDYRSRGIWVNYLLGGSKILPNRKGLNIPVDMSFAFHSDAGTTMNDSIVGSLGIYCTSKTGKFENGLPRIDSRALTNFVLTNVTNDIRRKFEPNWTRRGMWDKSYFEARVPEVPAMLLELLSHQNFADMKYGLNPEFRFTVSRAVYKGILQFLSTREGREFMVQPLPVNSFAITPKNNNNFRLSWLPTADTLTANSDASQYLVYERVNDGAFKLLDATANTTFDVAIKDNDIHSYKIVALNDGGRSFPSEVLSLCVAENSKGNVLVVNGFTRVCAPDWFELNAEETFGFNDSKQIAGFYDAKDHGVPYVKDISFIGSMYEFRRNIPWMDDDAAGFGASRGDYEDKVVAGNTFDYPFVHGKSIAKAGYSFVSSSVKAVEDGAVNLKDFKLVDLILGKQKETMVGRGAMPNKFKAFTPALQKQIVALTEAGGNIFVSGSYVASDIWDNKFATEEDKDFAKNVLGYTWRVNQASIEDGVIIVPSTVKEFTDAKYDFARKLNEEVYAVESPDSFFATDSKVGSTFMRYAENNLVAGIVTDNNKYKTCIVGFPFETIQSQQQRDNLMSQVLKFLSK